MNLNLKHKQGASPKIHIYFCITHTFDYMTTTFFDTMLSMKTEYSYSVLRNNMLPIDRNRTHLVSLAMQDPTMTHCLFLDTDIVPNDKDFLDIMVSYDLPILGLLCTKKQPPYEPIIYRHDAPKEETVNGFWTKYPEGLVEVDAVGTGCLLVKREVFKSLKKPYFRFINSYEHDVYQSEDVYFIEAAKKEGYKAFVDTEHTCKHYGIQGFGIEDFKKHQKSSEE